MLYLWDRALLQRYYIWTGDSLVLWGNQRGIICLLWSRVEYVILICTTPTSGGKKISRHSVQKLPSLDPALMRTPGDLAGLKAAPRLDSTGKTHTHTHTHTPEVMQESFLRKLCKEK